MSTGANKESGEPSSTAASGERSALRFRWPWFVLIGLAIVLFGLWMLRHPIPTVTRQACEEAQSRWEAKGLKDYHMQVRVTGRQGARYDVRVKEGRVVEALRNGESLGSGPSLETWSVAGMFRTILFDLEGLERRGRDANEGSSPRPSLLLRCEFDRERGIPLRYQRIEWGQGSTNPDVSWTVDKFEKNP